MQKQLEDKEKLADFQTKALEKQVEQLIDANNLLRDEAERAKLALEQAEQPWWKKLLSPSKTSVSMTTTESTGTELWELSETCSSV